MNARSSRFKCRATPKDPRRSGERASENPTERAFVIQFDPIGGARSRLRGRVELVASSEAIRFRSLKQLVGFLVDTLRKRAGPEAPSRERVTRRTPGSRDPPGPAGSGG